MRIEKQVSMIIGADIVPTQENQQLFTEGNINALVGENIEKILYEADLRLFNLEAPLITMKHPIKKNGPILGVPTSAIKGIKKLNPSCLTVANNHIMDHDVEGMETTCQMLKDVGIPYVGVGKDITSMLHSYVIEKNGLKIGIYVCVEHEFSIATKYRAGANPFDPFESFDHVSILKEKCDYLIVLYHGGKEMYRYPTPNLQKTCRKLVEKGADLVVCQHSHCIGCEENFLGKKLYTVKVISYSGNMKMIILRIVYCLMLY